MKMTIRKQTQIISVNLPKHVTSPECTLLFAAKKQRGPACYTQSGGRFFDTNVCNKGCNRGQNLLPHGPEHVPLVQNKPLLHMAFMLPQGLAHIQVCTHTHTRETERPLVQHTLMELATGLFLEHKLRERERERVICDCAGRLKTCLSRAYVHIPSLQKQAGITHTHRIHTAAACHLKRPVQTLL